MQIEKKNVDELKAAAYNPRKDLQPGDAEYEKLKRSILEFGYVEPVIWNKRTGIVVGGHQRLKVMKDLGYAQYRAQQNQRRMEQRPSRRPVARFGR